MGRFKLALRQRASKMKAAWQRPRESLGGRLRSSVDIVAAAALALLAALLAFVVPDGAAFRIYVTLAILLTVPGYLLVQTVVVPTRRPRTRAIHLLLGVGVSPVVVGLAALSTAVVDGGFKPVPIVMMVTITCLSLAMIAFIRRSLHEDTPAQTTTAPQAADN